MATARAAKAATVNLTQARIASAWGLCIRLQISPMTSPAMRPPRWACHEMFSALTQRGWRRDQEEEDEPA